MSKKDIEVNILQKYFKHLISSEPILGEIQSHRTIHAGGFRYKNENKELLSPLKKVSITIEITGDDILNYNLERFAENIYNFTHELIDHKHLMMLDTLNNITDFTGNVIDAKGKSFSFDLCLDMLEKLEIRFDDKGNPILPSMVVGTELFKKIKDTKMTKEQEERHNQIIDAKRKQYYAEKRNRRLSFIN